MMEEIKNSLQVVLDQLQVWGIEPLYLAGGLGFLVLLIIIMLARRKPKAKFPGLMVNLFQVAPLGKDAFLKIQNPANPVVLSQYKIIGRKDISVKNHLSGHRLDTQKEYSILLEANGNERLDADFSMVLTYIDDGGIVYQQKLHPDMQKVNPPKRL